MLNDGKSVVLAPYSLADIQAGTTSALHIAYNKDSDKIETMYLNDSLVQTAEC